MREQVTTSILVGGNYKMEAEVEVEMVKATSTYLLHTDIAAPAQCPPTLLPQMEDGGYRWIKLR